MTDVMRNWGARLLQNRLFVRAPIPMFRAGLGFLFTRRLLMLEHVGRTSGAARFVVLEVVAEESPTSFVVASGFGPKAQWFRNLRAEPMLSCQHRLPPAQTGPRRHPGGLRARGGARELPRCAPVGLGETLGHHR